MDIARTATAIANLGALGYDDICSVLSGTDCTYDQLQAIADAVCQSGAYWLDGSERVAAVQSAIAGVLRGQGL